MTELKVGQRWIYKDSSYIWVVECVDSVDPTGKVIQIIKDPYSGNMNRRFGMSAPKEGNYYYWTYLPGQDVPKP